MAVDDHGIEAIRKSAREVTPGDKSDYYLFSGNRFFMGTDYDVIDVTYPTDTQEVFTYSLSSTTVQVVTVDYTDSSKEDVLKLAWSTT